MSEEEKKAIKIVNSLKEWGKIHLIVKDRSYARLTYNEVYLLLNLIEKQQKENEQLNALNEGCKIELENKNKEVKELKEKYDKDTHTLQNQLDIANADIVEKDKIIDLMANFMNKRSWKEHQVKDDICFCCKIEYSSKECVNCIKQYFEKKAEEIDNK